MAALTQDKALAGCHAWMQSKLNPVPVHVKQAERRTAFFSNVQTCGKVWLCAHCQPKVAARRAVEARQAVEAWKAQGGDVLLVTFTFSHGRTDPLADSLKALKDAGQRLARHRSFASLKASCGLVGRIVGTEITHGANGWHPHQHQLWFVAGGTDREDVKEAMDSAWQASLVKSGFTASDAHGVRVDGGDHAAAYVAKMGDSDKAGWSLAEEIALSGSKVGRNGSRSLWQILDTWADKLCPKADRSQAAALLHEYAEATKGVKALKWSPGLKARFGIGEVSDEVLAVEATDNDTQIVTMIPPDQWPVVAHHRAQADVLLAAEDHGAAGVEAVLAALPPVPSPTKDGGTEPRSAPSARSAGTASRRSGAATS